MPRVTKAKTAKSKHKKVLAATKGHYGARSRLYKTAKQSNIKRLIKSTAAVEQPPQGGCASSQLVKELGIERNAGRLR